MLPLRKITLLLLSTFVLAGDGIPRFDSIKRAVPGHGLILESHVAKSHPDRIVNVEMLHEDGHGPAFHLLQDDDVVHSSHSHKVELSGMAPGRGGRYVAASPIAAGEEILSIPMDNVMSAQSAKEGRIHLLVDANPHLPPAVVLALHLLEEKHKGPSSKWHSFISTLPKTLHSTIFLSDAIADFYDALESPLTSNIVDPPFFTPAQFTLKSFQWAMAAVWAHSILVPKLQVDPAEDADQFDAVLVPVVSTLTPCHDCDNRIQVEAGHFTLIASQALAQGDEVQFHLGTNSMALYMLNHGFAPATPSSADAVAVGIQVEPSDPLLLFKNQILAMMNTTMDVSYAPAYGMSTDTILASMLPSMRAKTEQTKDLLRTLQVEQEILITTEQAIQHHWLQLLVDDSLLSATTNAT
ncbi:hypothetical protein B5M09_008109 [Aphanomyces astaci]|uniref:Rubisco LSMT substrate-binding domain-containing protein n=1 Tax=Aphanomyces astaci TaxID=112090 RepID=A0A3R7WAD4_APHAT|nr:hypothetical protein B5M09_008109 [Aphanomyces astaci]